MPLKLVLGGSVYSLGVVGGIMSVFKGLVRGEISELTNLIYEAREKAIDKIKSEAAALGADDVMGVQTSVYQLGGGMIEFMAIGTAVKKVAGGWGGGGGRGPPGAARGQGTTSYPAAGGGGGRPERKRRAGGG